MKVNVIGAGLAGTECAWQLAKSGIEVDLYEMKPSKHSPAHHKDTFAELVCSNSLRGAGLENAPGLLKEEMRRLDSVIIKSADETKVPAGGCLAVDRELFSETVTNKINSLKNVNIINKEITTIPDGITVIATGPLTSDAFSSSISKFIGEDYLHFFDAAAPVVTKESIDFESAYIASRYDKGEAAYINCPMTKEEYDAFYQELINAECAVLKEFEQNNKIFEGCMPVEVMAKRGEQTLLFGPLKPVGLPDPKTGKDPYAVVQLRQDNSSATLYNIVGFQTHLKFGEQKRVFGMIPALKNAEFVRYGVMHRNTYINSPKLLDKHYSLKKNPNIYFAGQITGVEGYIESAASGLLVGIYIANKLLGKDEVIFPKETAIGALSHYVSDETVTNFQPMNINFGIISSLNERYKNKKDKNTKISERALKWIDEYIKCN